MDTVINYVQSLPVAVPATAGGGVLLVVVIVIASVVNRRRFSARVHRFLEMPGRLNAADFFTDAELLRRTSLLERMADREGDHVVKALGLDKLWTERLYEKERPSDFRRVLRWGTEGGLFACFLTALRSRRLAGALRGYLEQNPDFLVLRKLALSGRGEDFDGDKARRFFSNRIDEIREMVGDPEWPSRYFSVKILLYDPDPRSNRALQDTFSDPHPLVRKTVVAEYADEDRQSVYARLEDAFLHDPVFEVREAARARIRRDFADLYSLEASRLEPEEALHVVGLLDERHPDDVNAAMELLGGDNGELRLAAARFLDRSRTLHSLLLRVGFHDREEMERVRRLLSHAVEVNVVGFLSGVTENPSPPSLLIAAELLSRHGPQSQIVEVAERVFRLQRETTEAHDQIYRATVDAIRNRGCEQSQRLLAREIMHRRDQPELLRIALSGVPSGCDPVFADTLRSALLDPDFPERDALRSAFLKLDTAFVLSHCIDIINTDREEHAHRIRIDALLLLGELRLPYTLQEILEHLPILPVEVAREFTKTLHDVQPDELERKVRKLLNSVDGNIRAAVIAALPSTGKRTFLTEIKNALDDADPDVRIAATWSLVDYNETRAVNQAADLLRDPVARVRESVARALAVGGGKSALARLRETLADTNEVESVKVATIRGLGASDDPDAVDALVEALHQDAALAREAEAALAGKEDSASMRRLVEQFKDAEPTLRDRITAVFRAMGEGGEPVIREVLEEDIAGLRRYLAEILETTGYVESRIRLLNHRDPAIRRDAAAFLARVGSEAAFRGIVMAARDPDAEVRVQVTKALERLASDDGRDVLRVLENDPDRRIRKYTHWALERLEAKSL